MYTQTINLNLIPQGVPPVIHVNQYDTQLNALIFSFYKGTETYSIPNNIAVLIDGLKPDGNVFSYAAASYSGNTVTCNIERQMVPLAGEVVCELRFRSASEIIGTCNFILQVEPAPLQDDSVISETTIPLIEQAIDIAANLAEYIETTLTAARTATAASEAAATSASEAAIYNGNVQTMYNSLETVKQNANAAAQAANTAAQAAEAATETLEDLSATATTLTPGSAATASYNSQTGVITFGIPQGAQGLKGDSGITTPATGWFTMYVEPDTGDLYVVSQEDLSDAFEYDSVTGNLYFLTDDGEEEVTP